MGLTLILNIVIPLILISVVALIVTVIIKTSGDDESLSMGTMIKIFVAGFSVIFIAIIGFAFFRAWILSTGWKEVNHPFPKAQEVAYNYKPFGSINNRGLEPNVSTRLKARALVNPVKPTPESIRQGKDFFLNYCKPCHGVDGKGQGVMGSVPMLSNTPITGDTESLRFYLSGFIGSKPDFDMEFVQNNTDGDIFYTITNGGEAIMPSFKEALYPDERWNLINYIKRELGKPNAAN